MRQIRRQLLLVLVLVLCITPGLAAVGSAQDGGQAPSDPGGEIALVRTDAEAAELDGIDLAIRLSQQVNPTGAEVRRVVLASSASFADALSASVLQADGPLLLTPPTALPTAVMAELVRLRPLEVVILGGPAALSPAVEADVQDLGLLTTRLEGPSRIETAAAVAGAAAPSTTTAIVVRAFDAEGGNGSAAWADSVTAGAIAAETGWPILLTTTDGLSPATRAHLSGGAVQSIIIVGGEAAVSRTVEQELLGAGHLVDRIAGHNRVETALLVARARGVASTGRVVLVPGAGDLGWQTGIAAAQHAAGTRAAILPTREGAVPEEVAAQLAAAAPVGFTCLVSRTACEQARALAGMPSLPLVSLNPGPGSALADGEEIVVGVDDPERLLRGEAGVSSDCPVSGIEYLPEGTASFSLSTDTQEEPGGDQAPPTDGVPVQPAPGTGQATGEQSEPDPVQTVSPVDPGEPAPADAPLTTCTVTTTFARADGGEQVDVAAFHVVDLRPRIRVTNFRQVEDDPVTFADRSDGLIEGWAWDFGDGRSSTDRNPTHTYRERGCLDVDLEITSPLSHWSTGRQFREVERRTLAIDPSDEDAHVEVLIIDVPAGDARLVGHEVRGDGPGGPVFATTGSDGRAVFGDLPVGDWAFNSVTRPEDEPLIQRVVPGHTLCPQLKLGPKGDLLVRVLDDTDRPIADAVVTISRDGQTRATGFSDARGEFLLERIPVGSYDVVATDAGVEVNRATGTVVQDELTVVVVQEPPPPPPPAPPAEAAPADGT